MMKKFGLVVVASAAVLSAGLSVEAAGRRSRCACSQGTAAVAPAIPAIPNATSGTPTPAAQDQAADGKFSKVKTSAVSESEETGTAEIPSAAPAASGIKGYSAPRSTTKRNASPNDAGWKIRTGGVAH